MVVFYLFIQYYAVQYKVPLLDKIYIPEHYYITSTLLLTRGIAAGVTRVGGVGTGVGRRGGVRGGGRRGF